MTIVADARFGSIREWVRIDLRCWTLADYIDDAGFESLVEAAESELARYTLADGRVSFPAPAHILVCEP